MRRTAQDEETTQGQDSFLDVVANMVGILILLVMVVGLRASKLPPLPTVAVAAPTAPAPSAAGPASELPREIAELQSEISKLAQQVAASLQEESLREAERVHLAAHAVEVQRELDRRKAELTADEREEHEIVHALTSARTRLDELAAAQMAMAVQTPKVETVENLPTPLAQIVRGDELHLRLSRGMVSVIPIDELVSGLEQHVRDNAWKLSGQSELEETLGPVNGFRLRYRVVQRRLVAQTAAGPLNQGNVVQLDRWELLPMADDLGQPVEQALMPGSELHRALAETRPGRTTITVWTYPDSFGAFRRLKRALFDAGFATAARPLPEGIRIGGSPRGSKSVAQ
jgi:hypothetical protein